MRPDYTISLWPATLAERAAEHSDKILHLHFDAKYRVDALTELFGEDSSADDGPDVSSKTPGTARRDDLLKMHAYRDAIRRSASAFVLYPGSENRRWRAYTEILPGLGAIALAPDNGHGKVILSGFLDEAVEYVSSKLGDPANSPA